MSNNGSSINHGCNNPRHPKHCIAAGPGPCKKQYAIKTQYPWFGCSGKVIGCPGSAGPRDRYAGLPACGFGHAVLPGPNLSLEAYVLQ